MAFSYYRQMIESERKPLSYKRLVSTLTKPYLSTISSRMSFPHVLSGVRGSYSTQLRHLRSNRLIISVIRSLVLRNGPRRMRRGYFPYRTPVSLSTRTSPRYSFLRRRVIDHSWITLNMTAYSISSLVSYGVLTYAPYLQPHRGDCLKHINLALCIQLA